MGLIGQLGELSLREFYACAEAHNEMHGGKPKPKPMSAERLDVLGIGNTVIITDFKGGKHAHGR